MLDSQGNSNGENNGKSNSSGHGHVESYGQAARRRKHNLEVNSDGEIIASPDDNAPQVKHVRNRATPIRNTAREARKAVSENLRILRFSTERDDDPDFKAALDESSSSDTGSAASGSTCSEDSGSAASESEDDQDIVTVNVNDLVDCHGGMMYKKSRKLVTRPLVVMVIISKFFFKYCMSQRQVRLY